MAAHKRKNMSFPERLNFWLVESGMTKPEFAKKIGRPYSTIARWGQEGGSTNLDGLQEIANGFNLTLAEFFGNPPQRKF